MPLGVQPDGPGVAAGQVGKGPPDQRGRQAAALERRVRLHVLRVRERLRARRDYETADAVRNALAAAGVELQDTAAGADWSLRSGAR